MRLPILLLAAFLAGCTTVRDAPQPSADLLVSAAWLADHLDDPDLVVLHVGRERAGYDAGHVPSARFLPLSAVAVHRDGQLNVLPQADELEEAFEAAGVSDDSHVVLYGDMGGLAATRAFFALDVHGHERVSVLDGGLDAWRSAGGAVSTEAQSAARGSFTPRFRPELVVDAAWVEARREDPQVVLVDARPAAEHTGEVPGEGIERPGHIPGSVNRFWKDDTREDGTLRPAEELRARYAAALAPGREVVTYCRTGVQGSHAYFVARYLGLAPRLYDGSFYDWSNNTDYPVTQGD